MGTGPHAELLTQPKGGAPCLAAAVIIIARAALVVITIRAMAITTVVVTSASTSARATREASPHHGRRHGFLSREEYVERLDEEREILSESGGCDT